MRARLPTQARILAGEEEGAYGWVAINYLKGTLVKDSEGSGTADPSITYGALEMGGASTQISFFKASQNIIADLFKLQVRWPLGGAQGRWLTCSNCWCVGL